MLFRTRYNVLFRQFRLLTAQAGSIPAAIRLIFETCDRSSAGTGLDAPVLLLILEINRNPRRTHTRRSGGIGSTRHGRLRPPDADTLFCGRFRRAAAPAWPASGGRFCGSLQTHRYKWNGREAWDIIHPFNPELAQNGLIWSAKKYLTIIPVYRGQTGAATMAALYLCKFCVRLTAVKLRTGWGVCRDVGGAGQHPYRPCYSGQRRPGAEQPATSSTLPGPSCTNRICSMKNCWPATRSAGATWCGTSA